MDADPPAVILDLGRRFLCAHGWECTKAVATQGFRVWVDDWATKEKHLLVSGLPLPGLPLEGPIRLCGVVVHTILPGAGVMVMMHPALDGATLGG